MNALVDPTRNGTITLPGAHQFTLVGLHWAGIPTDDEFARVLALCETVERANEWCQGDALVMRVRMAQKARPSATVDEIIGEYAQRQGESPRTLRDRYSVCKFYAWKDRRAELRYTHHKDVLSAGIGGSMVKAQEWLQMAKDGGWGVARLRAELIKAMRIARTSEPAIACVFPVELQDAVAWASGRIEEAKAMPSEAAAAQLEEMRALVDYVHVLEQRVKITSLLLSENLTQ